MPYAVFKAAAHAGMLAALGTALVTAGHHAVFDTPVSEVGRTAVAGLLFALALVWSGRFAVLRRQLTVYLRVQALSACCFAAYAGPAHGKASEAWPLLAAHLVLTVLLACLLHSERSGRRVLLSLLAKTADELRAWCARLRHALLLVCSRLVVPTVARARTEPPPAPASPRELALAGCVVRRGPPPGVTLAA